MIEKDFKKLLSAKNNAQPREPLRAVVQKMQSARQPDAEGLYWNDFLSRSQDTIIGSQLIGTSGATYTEKSSFGPHFKEKYFPILNPSTTRALGSQGNTNASSALIIAFAKALGHFLNSSEPVFGFNHASRSLASANSAADVDLTRASVPTLTTTPLSVSLEKHIQGTISSVKEHLAQLNKFSQGNILYPAKFNSYLNIIFSQANAREETGEEDSAEILQRYRLEEPLASDYFTKSEPSQNTTSAIDGLDTSHLCPHRLFFNVVVDDEQGITVSVSGDEMLFGNTTTGFGLFVQRFVSELEDVVGEMDESTSA